MTKFDNRFNKFTNSVCSVLLFGILVMVPPLGIAVDERFKQAGITQPTKNLMAPEFELESLTGEMLALSDFRGQVIILNFWGTFCAPCREEMPALERLWQRHKNKGLTVLGVAVDRDEQAVVKKFIDTYNIHFPIVHDPTDYTRDIYEVTGFPFSYIVDQGGRIIGRVIGAYDWESPEIEALVKQLLTHQSSKNHERQN